MIYTAIFIGCLCILALSFFIYSILKKAKVKAAEQQQIIDQHLADHQKRQEYITSSINIIVKAVNTDQIDVVEASIRLKVLVDQLRPNVTENSLVNIEHIFNETKHIPKLKDWKALDKKKRKQHTRDMHTLGSEFSAQVKEEVKLLAKIMEQR